MKSCVTLKAASFVWPFLLTIVQWGAAAALEPRHPAVNVWFTQIGQWQVVRDSVSGESFLCHNASTDGASSGQARANVRLNTPLEIIRSFSANLSLGVAPSSAGLLVRNKRDTYLFILQTESSSDSLLVVFLRDNKPSVLRAFSAHIPDTVRVSLTVKSETLVVNVGSSQMSLVKPTDFDSLTTVGFECPQGMVRVYDTEVEARGFVLEETFDKATLMNLHLDKMFKGSAKPSSGPESGR